MVENRINRGAKIVEDAADEVEDADGTSLDQG